MPQIPVYERRQQLTTQPAAAKRSESFAGSQGQAMQVMGQALGQVAERMQKVKLLNETTKASRYADNKMTEYYMQAQKDPDVWDMDKYNKLASQTREEAAGMISDRMARQQFIGQIDNKIAQGKVKIFNLKYKQQLQDTARENLGAMSDSFRVIKNSKDSKVIASEKNEAKKRLESIKDILTPAQYNAKKDYIEEDLEVERLENLARINPEYVEEFIQEKKQDKSYNLPAGKANEILKLSETVKKYRIKKRKQERQIKAGQVQDKWIGVMKEGKPSEGDLEQLEKDKLEYPEIKSFLQEIEKSITNPKTVGAGTENETMEKLIRDFGTLFTKHKGGGFIPVEDDNFKDVLRFRKEVMNAYAEGKINSTYRNKWLENTVMPLNEQADSYLTDKYNSNKLVVDKISWWSRTFGKASDDPQQIRARLMTRFFDRDGDAEVADMSDKQIDEYVDSMIKDFVREEYPELMGKEDIPNAMRNEEGQINKIYQGETNINPDEEYEEVMGEPDEYGYSIGQTFVGKDGKKYRYIGNNQAEEIE